MSYSPLTIEPEVECAYLEAHERMVKDVCGAFALPPSFFNRYFVGRWRITGQLQTLRFVPAPYYVPADAQPEPRSFEYVDRDEEFRQP